MKKTCLVLLLALAAMLIPAPVHAQSTTGTAAAYGFFVASGTTVAQCPPPVVGQTWMCFITSPSQTVISNNGLPYVNIVGSAPPATIVVGSTNTGAPGSPASVTDTGTPSAAVLNFVIPQGIQGQQGIQGIQGPQGNPGTMSTTCSISITPVTMANNTLTGIATFTNCK